MKKIFLTGCAGFIGSNILEYLLKENHRVIGFDNLSTGFKENLIRVQNIVSDQQWNNFTFVEEDILNYETLKKSMEGCSHVIHQAALGSVPRSINNPLATNLNNVDGTLNVFYAAKENNISRVVYASSSSVYGSSKELPKVEENIGSSLSPYATSKRSNEIYAESFSNVYDMEFIGLRYFNVFGKHQTPNGAYAAVIPRWISSILNNTTVEIYGDGQTTRDFTYIDNIVQLNIKSCFAELEGKKNIILNGACGANISLNELLSQMIKISGKEFDNIKYLDFRAGDIRDSLANIDKAKKIVNYIPSHDVYQGLNSSFEWYKNNLGELSE